MLHKDMKNDLVGCCVIDCLMNTLVIENIPNLKLKEDIWEYIFFTLNTLNI